MCTVYGVSAASTRTQIFSFSQCEIEDAFRLTSKPYYSFEVNILDYRIVTFTIYSNVLFYVKPDI
jgi:hypothetical protein